MGNFITNVWSKLFAMEDMRILMVGLDAAGKTTILYKLKLGELVTPIPTIGFNVEEVNYKNINFTMWDVGGQKKLREMWRFYYENTQAVIFVVDSADHQRVEHEAKEELHNLMNQEELKDCVFLIYANKQDFAGALNPGQLAEKLGLNQMRGKKWYVQSAIATRGDGLYEGLDWLSDNIKKTKTAGA